MNIIMQLNKNIVIFLDNLPFDVTLMTVHGVRDIFSRHNHDHQNLSLKKQDEPSCMWLHNGSGLRAVTENGKISSKEKELFWWKGGHSQDHRTRIYPPSTSGKVRSVCFIFASCFTFVMFFANYHCLL